MNALDDFIQQLSDQHQELADALESTLVQLELHHTGAVTLIPFKKTYDNDAKLLREGRILLRRARQI